VDVDRSFARFVSCPEFVVVGLDVSLRASARAIENSRRASRISGSELMLLDAVGGRTTVSGIGGASCADCGGSSAGFTSSLLLERSMSSDPVSLARGSSV
jgi:hypothetical protein